MARARNIKPSIMDNEDLAELDPLDRLLFIYLWMLADREGRLEDRPKRIAKQALAYDRAADAEIILARLNAGGFIRRYVVHGVAYIQILNFAKHQTPHGTEKDSIIPDEAGLLTVHHRTEKGYATGKFDLVSASVTVKCSGQGDDDTSALTVKKLGAVSIDNSASTVKTPIPEGGQNLLIPDSGFTDSLIQKDTPQPPRGGRPRRPVRVAPHPEGFLRWWAAWPAGKRKEAMGKCAEVWERKGCEAIADTIVAHVVQKRDTTNWAHEGGQFVEAPLVYLNQRRWEGAEVAVAPQRKRELVL